MNTTLTRGSLRGRGVESTMRRTHSNQTQRLPRRRDRMISRREWLGRSLGASAALALTPKLRRALGALRQQGGTLIQRAIPSSGELVPALGLSFSNHPGCADHAAITEVIKTFADSGGRVYDLLFVFFV